MRVLVTRPEPVAAQTAERLEVMGHEAVVVPLSKVEPVEAAVPSVTDFDAVAATSANAVRSASPELLEAVSSLRCFAVGDRTAGAARIAGFESVRSAGGDVYDLAALIGSELKTGGRVLYLCGERRRPVLEEILADTRLSVTPLETYRIAAVTYDAIELERLFATGPIDAVLVYSRYGAELLSGFLGDREGMRILCMSRQVAEGLSHSLRKSAEIASATTEDGLIALLGRAP
ncbi:MAG: uroporphyrinogen-III synthase [Rhizobiaceae bacterium]|nr:uroporphyrinogen-III synthase [Rhizobiaceae bacterium]